jgi:hypothetical protein
MDPAKTPYSYPGCVQLNSRCKMYEVRFQIHIVSGMYEAAYEINVRMLDFYETVLHFEIDDP